MFKTAKKQRGSQMGVFSRFTDIVNANINSALDRAEDPEKIVRLIIQEMEETLVEIRANTAGYLADKKDLDRKATSLSRQAAEWGSKAELAITKDREDLARAALVQKQSIDEDVSQLTSDIDKLSEILTALQEDSARLQSKLAEAKARQKAMDVRQTAVVTRLKVRQQTHSTCIDKAIEKFDRYERKIDQLEAQVEAYDMTKVTFLSAEFRKMEHDDKVEDALTELKKKVANG
jgi:phage shock protein A